MIVETITETIVETVTRVCRLRVRGMASRMVVCFVVCHLLTVGTTRAESPIDFNRDIRPILSDACFRCHGPDEGSRQADLRLDRRDEALQALRPDDPGESELLRRIESGDAEEQMPPPGSQRRLTDAEKVKLRQWVESGAAYAKHWAFVVPRPSAPPTSTHSAWVRNPIDHFVAARFDSEGLGPSPEADRGRLIRRLSLDLIGLPPSPDELAQFLADKRPDAYERAVDRLLASPHFGERMAIDWLDAARYADTHGYFGDKPRGIWPWRDWVINAFNANMPFDQFTIKQLAGDLLATMRSGGQSGSPDDLIATGFLRNHMANDETGLIDEEYRVEYVADRLETTATTWMGLTIGCARCHDHKYDPITQRDYYRLFDFFNQGPETGLIRSDNPPPSIEVPTPEQVALKEELRRARVEAEELDGLFAQRLAERIASWEKRAGQELGTPPQVGVVLHESFEEQVAGSAVGTSIKYEAGVFGKAAIFDATQHVGCAAPLAPDGPWTIGLWMKATHSLSCPLSVIRPTDDRRGVEVIWQKGRWQINLVHRWGSDQISLATRKPVSAGAWHHLVITYDGSKRASGVRVFVDGELAGLNIQHDTLRGTIDARQPLLIGRRDAHLGFYGSLDELRVLSSCVTDEEAVRWYWSERLLGILAVPEGSRGAAEKELVSDYVVDRHAEPEVRMARHRLKGAREAEQRLIEAIPTTLVAGVVPTPRETKVLERGQYDHPGEIVTAGVPEAIAPWPDGASAPWPDGASAPWPEGASAPWPDGASAPWPEGASAPWPEGASPDRLGFARWLVSGEHPLTARVAVNRFWQQCFGEGIVRTVGDYGYQGDAPSHPELLDWLAVRFVESGWDVKGMLRLIVCSATYRQSSSGSRELLERDPSNRMLARGGRFRLAGELLRDQALAASGLLVSRIGGPSVKPYQPPGVWESVSYNGDESYQQDAGEGLWRRGVYTYWKRQSPPPSMLTFDGPTREKCTVQRARTNTPLQALVVLNDPTYVEAARVMAAGVIKDHADDRVRVTEAFARVLGRFPEAEEGRMVTELLANQRARYGVNPDDAAKLVAVGESRAGGDIDAVELAAWTLTVHTLMNLDEAITRR
jgi:hypothetical protein